MRIALLGYFGFGNAGDEAILAAELSALRSAFAAEAPASRSPGDAAEALPTFVVISGDPGHTRRTHGVDAVSRTDVRAVLAALRSSAALVAGGGSLLQDVTSARPVAFYAGTMLAARAVGTPVFVYAQGLGPVRRPVNRGLTGAALRASRYVALRDAASVALAERLGVRDVDLVPDPVLGVDLSSGHAPPSVGSDRPRLAVALRPWAGSEHWLPAVRSALTELATEADIVLVPFHAGQDADLARELAADLGSGAEVVDVGAGGRDGHQAALDAVAGATAVLGMRLHALIAAAGAGRPFVALSYDPKVTAFADRVGQPVAATLPDPSGGAAGRAALRDNVVAAVRKALQGPDQAYLDRLTVLRADATRPATTIALSLLGLRS